MGSAQNDYEKKEEKILIIIGLMILAVIIFFAICVVKDLRQEKALQDEISSIEDLTDPEQMDMDAINEKLKRTVTSGDYAKVEKAVKSYIADNINNAITIAEVLNDEMLTGALTADNYMADGPDFVKTKLVLDVLKEQLSKAQKEMKHLSEDKTVMAYLKDKDDSYYVDLYKEIMGEEKVSSDDANEVEQNINEILDVITAEQNVIDFLAANKGMWAVQDGAISFASDELIEQYNQLLLQIP